MMRKLAIEVQQVKSSGVGLVLKSVLYRLQSAHAHGLQLQMVGWGVLEQRYPTCTARSGTLFRSE